MLAYGDPAAHVAAQTRKFSPPRPFPALDVVVNSLVLCTPQGQPACSFRQSVTLASLAPDTTHFFQQGREAVTAALKPKHLCVCCVAQLGFRERSCERSVTEWIHCEEMLVTGAVSALVPALVRACGACIGLTLSWWNGRLERSWPWAPPRTMPCGAWCSAAARSRRPQFG